MSTDSGKTAKKSRRGDRATNEARTNRNKARRMKRAARLLAVDALKRPRRLAKRKAGALRRWERRYPERLAACGSDDGAKARLMSINSRIRAATA